MSLLVSLLLFLGVISTEADFDEAQTNYYETEYATEENYDAYFRQSTPLDDDTI